MSTVRLNCVLAILVLAAGSVGCTGESTEDPDDEILVVDARDPDADATGDAGTAPDADETDLGFDPEIPVDVEYLELAFDDGDVWTPNPEIFAVEFPVSVTVAGVDRDGGRLNLTGHPDLSWRVAPGDVAEIDPASSQLTPVRAGEVQVSVEVPRTDGEVVSASRNLRFAEPTFKKWIVQTQELHTEADTDETYALQLLEGVNLTPRVLLYVDVAHRMMVVPVTPDRADVTTDDAVVDVVVTQDGWELRPAQEGRAELNLAYRGNDDSVLSAGSVSADVLAGDDVERLELELRLNGAAVELGDDAQLSARLAATFRDVTPARRQWAVGGGHLTWETPSELLGPIECSRPGAPSCRAPAVGEGTGTVRAEGTFGDRTLEASTSVEVYDPGAIDRLSLDPPNLSIAPGEQVCQNEWALHVHYTDRTSELVDLSANRGVMVEERRGDEPWEPAAYCWSDPGPTGGPLTVRVTYRTHTTTGMITFD